MKITFGVIILSILIILVASPVSSSYFADRIEVTSATGGSPPKSDSNDQETSKSFPILLSMSFISLVAVRRPTTDK